MCVLLTSLLMGCDMTSGTNTISVQGETLPLFDPYKSDFLCSNESTRVPAMDAEADDWFRKATSLESEIMDGERDYKLIIALTRRAAERHHWKAILNLASLYVEGRDADHGVSEAVELVEQAMKMGIPAAYDRMGTFYLNGTGVEADATKAYALFQRAAEMGNPDAMFYLSTRLDVADNSPQYSYWSNKPLALKLNECAFAQGYGKAAWPLHYAYRYPRDASGTAIAEATQATNERALRTLHAGVKLGCLDCAITLAMEFSNPIDPADTITPFQDKARADRYRALAAALEFRSHRRFPNLDRVIPLPPAELPPWDGNKDSLIDAAIGVVPSAQQPEPTKHSRAKDRKFLAAEFELSRTSQRTTSLTAPCGGYWSPDFGETAGSRTARFKFDCDPQHLSINEPFAALRDAAQPLPPNSIWHRWLTVRNNDGAVEPVAPAGIARQVKRPAEFSDGVGEGKCPRTGVWQPWVGQDHPLQLLVNQFWRQAFVREGNDFPQPARDWLLDLPADQLTWYPMELGECSSLP